MRVFGVFLRASPGLLLLAAVLGLFAGVVGMGLIAQVNAALQHGMGWGRAAIALFFGLCVLRAATAVAAQLALDVLGQRSIHQLRMKLSDDVLRAPLRTLEKLGPAKLLAVLSEDVTILADGGLALARLLTGLAFVLACGAYLCWLSAPAFGAVLVAILAGLALQRWLDVRADVYFDAAEPDRDELYTGFRGITEGSKELKLHAERRDAFVLQAIEAPAERYRHKHLIGGAFLTATRHWFSFVFLVVVGLLLFAWPRAAHPDAGIVVSFVVTVLYMQASVEGMLTWLPALAYASRSLRTIDSLRLSVAADAESSKASPLSGCANIRLRDVVHEYEGEGGDGTFTLGPVDLELAPGEVVFVIGGNGSGKSTLGKVLTGLYVPQGGHIEVDGQAVTDATRAGYRQLFSAVFSDWYLFDRLFGLDANAVQADSGRYLSELRLDKKVEVRDGKFSTTALSQGQRKRLMLLTAYLEDRPVYVFDEWASDQDPVFKEIFYTQILKRLKERGKMVVVISHDDRYFGHADRVVRLEDGKVRSS